MLKTIDSSTRPILCANEEIDDAPERLLLSDLAEGAIRAVKTARGQTAIIILQDGKPRAFDARCPHMGADLSKATCVGSIGDVVCAWHGYRYSGKTGALIENPNEAILKAIRTPSTHFDPRLRPPHRLREYPLEIRDGWVVVK